MRRVRTVREFFGSFLAYGTRVPRELGLSLASELFTRLTNQPRHLEKPQPEGKYRSFLTAQHTKTAPRQTEMQNNLVDKIGVKFWQVFEIFHLSG
ncbi:MAG: hypothetical protein HQM05_13630 [Magnetococcales bacterium]|nr:hypothetical protein [Magnetococcales bacterium]